MKHVKLFNESSETPNNDDLLIIKDIFQEIVDEFDLNDGYTESAYFTGWPKSHEKVLYDIYISEDINRIIINIGTHITTDENSKELFQVKSKIIDEVIPRIESEGYNVRYRDKVEMIRILIKI